MPDRDNGRLQNELGWHDDRGNLLRFLDDPGIEPTNNRARASAARGGDSAKGVALLEERRWRGCVQCVHQRNQDPGLQGWWSVGGGWSVWCVQRRACPRPLHLNLFPTSTPPLINYVLPYVGDVVQSKDQRPFLTLTWNVNQTQDPYSTTNSP